MFGIRTLSSYRLTHRTVSTPGLEIHTVGYIGNFHDYPGADEQNSDKRVYRPEELKWSETARIMR